MLTFESPFYEESGVVIFRDHADPALFHYLAGPPRLTRDASGRPNLMLLKYRRSADVLSGAEAPRRDQLGGGFLLFGVDCGLDPRVRDDIERAMQARVPAGAGPVSLVPVLYSEGTVRVLALDHDADRAAGEAPEGTFVRRVLGTARPSLLHDQRAIFALELGVDGVVLIEEAFESELSPIGVMYELEFAGLRPALQVKARVALDRVYEKLEAKLGVSVNAGGGSGAGSSGDTGSATNTGSAGTSGSATDTGSAGDASTSGSGAGAATAVPAAATGGAAGASSQPETSASSGAGQGNRGGQAGLGVEVKAELGFVLEELREENALEIEILRQQQGEAVDAMERRALELLKETLLEQFFRPVMSTAAVDPQRTAAQLQQATSQLVNQGQAGAGAAVQVGFELRYHKREELKTAEFDYRVRAPETRTHAPNGFFSALVGELERARHIRTIDLDDPFFQVLDVHVSTTADFAALHLDALIVELAYGPADRPATTRSFALRPSAPDAPEPFRAFRDQGDGSYRYRVEYKFGDTDETASATESLLTPWQQSRSGVLVVHPPDHLDLLRVLLEPARIDWGMVSRIEAVVRYRDPASGFSAQRTFAFSPTTSAKTWTLRLPDGASVEYTVQLTWYLAAGNRIAGGEVSSRERRFFVNDPFVDRLPITVDPQVAPEDVSRLLVELRYEDEANGLVVRHAVEMTAPEFRARTVEIPIIDPERRTYEYRVRLVKPGGQTEEMVPRTTDALTVVVTPGGTYFDVDVALLGNLTGLGLSAVQIDLRAAPLDGQSPRVDSHLFLPGEPMRTTRRLLIRADRPSEFEHRAQLFFDDGRVVEREWRRHDGRILPVPLASLVTP